MTIKKKIENKKQEKHGKEKIKKGISFCFNNIIIETVHKPKERETYFLISDGDKVIMKKSYTIDNIKHIPLKGSSSLLTDRALFLPEKSEAYEDEQILFTQIQSFIHKYVDISDDYELVSTSFVLLSWIYEKFDAVPYLRVMGDFSSGKTTYLRVMQAICCKANFLGGASSIAGIYRTIDKLRGTLILDEADFYSSNKKDRIIKVLNQGYTKGSPLVLVDSSDNTFEPKTFQVFSPKIIANREPFQDEALESRCLTEVMGKAKIRKDVCKGFEEDFYIEASLLRNKLLQYRFDNLLTIKSTEFKLDDKDIHERSKQIFLPLIAVTPSKENKFSLEKVAIKHSNSLKKIMCDRVEYEFLLAILTIYKTEQNPTVKEINEIYSAHINSDGEWCSDKRAGVILGKKMILEKIRAPRGWTIPKTKNKQRIEFLKQRYRITEDILKEYDERVNIMHNTAIGTDLTKEKINAFFDEEIKKNNAKNY